MAQSAKVLSIQSLKDFRIALINFTDEARNALSGVDMELKRMRNWLERDQLSYWQMQVKRRHEAMMMARTELHRRKLSQQGSDAISDTEQKEALRDAQRKLHAAEEKVETVKRLIPVFHHAAAEYMSCATPLADHLTGGMDRTLTSLARMVESLESYLAMAPPEAPRAEVSDGASSAGGGMAAARVAGVGASENAAAATGDAAERTAAEDAPAGEASPADRQVPAGPQSSHEEPAT